MSARRNLLLNIYGAMLGELGPSEWWPGDSPFEIAVGAILTQNTNWANVEKAITGLKRKDLLSPQKLYALPEPDLAELIRPAGYFRIKANRLKNFLTFLHLECALDIETLKNHDMDRARNKLLSVRGIGPETADSILLYSLDMPSFVVDAYTRRIMNRHMLVPEDVAYDELRAYFMDALPPDTRMYNEYHALLVRVGKKWCKKKNGQCNGCPLQQFLE